MLYLKTKQFGMTSKIILIKLYLFAMKYFWLDIKLKYILSKNLCYSWLLVTCLCIRYVTLFAPVCFFSNKKITKKNN